MKKLLAGMLLLVCCCAGMAQVKTIRDASGSIVAMECANGNIKHVSVQPNLVVLDTLGVLDTLVNENIEEINASENIMLYLQDSITITDPSGVMVATYDSALKEMRDANSHLLFTLDETNQVINNAGIVMGWVDGEGNLFGNDANKIASGPGIMPFKLVYLFFYSNK